MVAPLAVALRRTLNVSVASGAESLMIGIETVLKRWFRPKVTTVGGNGP